MTPRPRQQAAQGGPGAAERPGQRDVEHGRPLLVGHLDQRHRPAQPGVVHRHVDAPEVRRRPRIERPHLRLIGDVTGHGADRAARSRPPVARPSRPDGARGRRRRTTVAPSSRQRRAVAEPIPVPAAAVTITTLPTRRPCPAGGGGWWWRFESLRSGSRRPFRFGRQTEHPLTDDVALDLVGATVDRLGTGVEKERWKLAQFVALVLGPRLPSMTVAAGPSTSMRELTQTAVPAAPVQLGDGGLGRRHRPVDARRGCATCCTA